MFFKKLFYASAALLMLAIAYHLGASTATAQSTGTFVAMTGWKSNLSSQTDLWALASDGSVYRSGTGTEWILMSSVGGVPTIQTSWGALKVQSR